MRLLPTQAQAVTLGIRSHFSTQVQRYCASHSLTWSPRYSHARRSHRLRSHPYFGNTQGTCAWEQQQQTHKIEYTLALCEVKSGAHSMCDEMFIQLSLRLDFVQVCSLVPTASNSDSNYWIYQQSTVIHKFVYVNFCCADSEIDSVNLNIFFERKEEKRI